MEEMVIPRGECNLRHENVNYRQDEMNSQIKQLVQVAGDLNIAMSKQVEINRRDDEIKNDHEDRIKSIETKPSRRMETVITAVLSALGGSGVTYIIARLFK